MTTEVPSSIARDITFNSTRYAKVVNMHLEATANVERGHVPKHIHREKKSLLNDTRVQHAHSIVEVACPST